MNKPATIFRRNARDRSGTSGATLIEAAIAIPLFLILTFELLYIGLYLFAQGNLDHAAAQALNVVTTSANFDTISQISGGSPQSVNCTAPPSNDAQFCAGIAAAKARAVSLATSGFIRGPGSSGLASLVNSAQNPNIIWPAPIPGESYQQTVGEHPIVMEVSATLSTFIPGVSPITVVGRAAGFRETNSQVSSPILLDCEGYPIGSPLYSPLKICGNCTADQSATQDAEHDWRRTDSTGKLVDTCWCPNGDYCHDHYGMGSMGFYDDGGLNLYNCSCICGGNSNNFWINSNALTPQDSCTCADPSRPPPGSYYSHTFTGYQVGPDLVNGSEVCDCTPKLDDTACNAIFPNAGGNAQATYTGCGCGCRNTCTDNGNGEAWPGWNPDDSNCNCYCALNQGPADPNRSYDSQKGCVCNAADTSCPSGKTIDQASCSCVCANTCADPNAHPDGDNGCSCVCDGTGTLGNCTAGAG